MAARNTKPRRPPKTAARLRRNFASKLAALTNAAKVKFGRIEARVAKAVARAEVKVSAAAKEAAAELAKVRRSAKKEAAVVSKTVKAKAARIKRSAKSKVAKVKKAEAPAKKAATRKVTAARRAVRVR